MKNIAIAIVLIASFMSNVTAQSFVEEHYGDLMELEETTVVNVSGKMFQMLSKFEDAADEEEAQEALRMMENVESFTLVKVDQVEDLKSLINRSKSDLKRYDELVRVRDNGTNVVISIDETNGIVHEIVGVVSLPEEGSFIAASLQGRIDLDEVSAMVSKFQEEGLPMLKERSVMDLEAVRVFPNPVDGGSIMTLEVDEDLIGGTATVTDLNGKAINAYTLDGVINSLETNNLAGGQHYIEVNNGEKSIRVPFIVVR